MSKWLQFPYSWIPGAKGRAEKYFQTYLKKKVEEEVMFMQHYKEIN